MMCCFTSFITYHVSLIFLWYIHTLHYITAVDSVITYQVSLIFLWYIHVTLYYCCRLSDYLPCEFDIFVVYTLHYITAGDSVITYHVSLIFLWYIHVTLYYCCRLGDYLPSEFDIFVVYTCYIILLLETQWLLTKWVWYFCGIYTLHYITAGDSVITYQVSLIFLWYIRYIILLL